MAHFDRLTLYKNNIAGKLIQNENIVKALVNNDQNFINQSLPSDFHPVSLLYSQIFPYMHVPGTNVDATTFITMSFVNFNYTNNEFRSGMVWFYIFTHFSLMKTNYGQRTDYILNEVDLLFNKKYGIGEFNLTLSNGGGDIHINEDYYGISMPYKFLSFQ